MAAVLLVGFHCSLVQVPCTMQRHCHAPLYVAGGSGHSLVINYTVAMLDVCIRT